jgi:hypothetical protein
MSPFAIALFITIGVIGCLSFAWVIWQEEITRFFALAWDRLRWEFFFDHQAVLHGIAALAAAGTIGYFLPHKPATVTVEKVVKYCDDAPTINHTPKPLPTPEQVEAAAHKEEVIIALRNMERGRKICAVHHHEVRWFLKCYAAGGNEFQGFEDEHYDARGRHKGKKSNPCEKDVVVCDQWVTKNLPGREGGSNG